MVVSPAAATTVPSKCPNAELGAFLDTVLAHAPPGNPAWAAAFSAKQSLSYLAPELLDSFWMKVYTTVLLPHVAPHDTEGWTFAIHDHWVALMLARLKDGGGVGEPPPATAVAVEV